MADKTHIEWTRGVDGTPGATWNPITGCSVVSPGCTNCYAMRLAGTRLQHHPSRAGLTTPTKAGPVWTGEVRFNAQWVDQPLRWRRPRRIFVCAHGDLFHESVPDEWIDKVFAVMALAPQHTFQVLTKRAERMREYMTRPVQGKWAGRAHAIDADGLKADMRDVRMRMISAVPVLFSTASASALNAACVWQDTHYPGGSGFVRQWPLPNVWLGVSAEDQRRADERIPHLLATPAAVRWLSAEPLLGPIDLTSIDLPGGWNQIFPLGQEHLGRRHVDDEDRPMTRLDWVVAGGESGPGARPMHPDWARGLRDQCQAAGVPYFLKQWGEWAPHQVKAGGDLGGDVRAGRVVVVHPSGRSSVDILAATGTLQSERGTLYMERVGKKAAGALLDGREWREMPR